MTDGMITLRELMEKGSDATLPREMIGFAAQRLIELETETLCGAGHGEHSENRTNLRNGYRDRDWQTRAGTVAVFNSYPVTLRCHLGADGFANRTSPVCQHCTRPR